MTKSVLDYQHIFLSPHFDDAVYSCGGFIYDLAQFGADVRVITVLGGNLSDVVPDTPIIRDLHSRWQAGDNPIKTRQTEDINALKHLGVDVEQWQYHDCVYRTYDVKALYPSEESLFSDVHVNDPLLNALDNQVDNLILTKQTILYVPLAVGHHVDHVLIRDWAINLWEKKGCDLYFYTDYPYLRDNEAIDNAFRDMKEHGDPAHVVFPESTMIKRLQAMRYYASQTSTFWKSDAEMEEETRRMFRHEEQENQYVERYWKIVD